MSYWPNLPITPLKAFLRGWHSPVIILPTVTELREWLVADRRCAMKQANIVHRISAAGLVIDAAIIPDHKFAQGPFMTIHVSRCRLVGK